MDHTTAEVLKIQRDSLRDALRKVLDTHNREPISGQPSRMIERVGRDEASAIAAWNMRAPTHPHPPHQ